MDHFKKTIEDFLVKKSQEDTLFTDKFNNPEKNIDDCIIYILNTVKKTERQGFNDDEIFSMAIHYYDEESIDIGEEIKAQVIINKEVEITDDDRKQIKKNAMDRLYEEEYQKLKKKPKKIVKEDKKEVIQSSLF